MTWQIHEWVDIAEEEVVGAHAECEISYELDGKEFYKYVEVHGGY